MSRKAMFDSVIAEPLNAVLGQTLLSLDYWILDCDKADFSEEEPNATGVMATRLHFEASELQVVWGFKELLRGNGIYYHVQLSLADEQGQEENTWVENFVQVTDVHAIWERALGRRLVGVEVLGFWDSPQAVRFSFSDIAVVVAVGYSGDPLLVGDGDELLVFGDQEWPDRSNTHDQPWERLWSASAIVPGKAFAK